MEDADLVDARPPSLVSLSPFSPFPRGLSTNFTKPKMPVISSARRRLAWVSLQGRLINAEEASSAHVIRGGFSPKEAIAWELFSPIERFLIVAVIGAATAESKKNRLLCQLRNSIELRDQVLLSMQLKLDNLCEQLNNAMAKTNTESTLNEKIGNGIGRIKFADCGCWICDQHHEQVKGNSLSKMSTGNEMQQSRMELPSEIEQEECRMSDFSDWASSVTSAAEIQLSNLAIEQDMFNLKRECEEKDAVIKELTASFQSSNMASSKRISELENIISRKNTTVAGLKKDMVILEQKVVQLTRLQRPSSTSTLTSDQQIPVMTDNLLYDMDSTTSPSSSDSNCSSKNHPPPSVPKVEEVTIQNAEFGSKREQKAAPVKVSSSFGRESEWQSKSQPAVTPLKEISINQKPHDTPSSSSSSRQRQVLANRNPKSNRRQHQSDSKDSASKKRWA